MAAYAQQDAHECLIALLNAAHASARGNTLLKCNCIVHSTFGGLLQSDMRCPRCNTFSETIDPCLDISLSLGLSHGQSTLAGYLKRCVTSELSNGEMGHMLTTFRIDRFTQPENIAVKDWACQKCGKVSQEANKRLSIKRLPPVLSIQFKVSSLFLSNTKRGLTDDESMAALRTAWNRNTQDRHSRACSRINKHGTVYNGGPRWQRHVSFRSQLDTQRFFYLPRGTAILAQRLYTTMSFSH